VLYWLIGFDLGQKITFLVPIMIKYCSWTLSASVHEYHTSHPMQLVEMEQYFSLNNLSAGKLTKCESALLCYFIFCDFILKFVIQQYGFTHSSSMHGVYMKGPQECWADQRETLSVTVLDKSLLRSHLRANLPNQ
jgi:hypothetical protein